MLGLPAWHAPWFNFLMNSSSAFHTSRNNAVASVIAYAIRKHNKAAAAVWINVRTAHTKAILSGTQADHEAAEAAHLAANRQFAGTAFVS